MRWKGQYLCLTTGREGGDLLGKDFCKPSLGCEAGCIRIAYLLPHCLATESCFQKRGESLKWLLTLRSSCPGNVRFNGVTVGTMMLCFLTAPAHATNMTLAGTEARHESDSVKNRPNLPNLWGLIQLLKNCLYPVKAITSDTISCKEGKSAISGFTERWWLLDCSSVCSSEGKEKKSQDSGKEIHRLQIKRVKMVWTPSLFFFSISSKHRLKRTF